MSRDRPQRTLVSRDPVEPGERTREEEARARKKEIIQALYRELAS